MDNALIEQQIAKIIWYKEEMQKLKEEGDFPHALPAGEEFGTALIALDAVFDLSDEVKDYINSNYPGGQPRFRIITDDPGELAIRLGSVSSPLTHYPFAGSPLQPYTRRGMLKWLIMQAWKRGKEDNLL